VTDEDMIYDWQVPAAVAEALTRDQRGAIQERFATVNPHMRGVSVADILSMLCDHDSDLEQVEPFFDAHPHLIVPGGSEAARALIWSGAALDEPSMRQLLTSARLGCTQTWRPWDDEHAPWHHCTQPPDHPAPCSCSCGEVRQ
jgi:hypothetical protein